jgi:HEPN domain-containing protein
MQEHERWLKIVEEDLKVAKMLLEEEVFATVTYHCQQAAEKVLKAYLVFKKQEVIKTHDLMKLVGLCCKLNGDFKVLHDATELLNPFATKFRYPTEFDVPDYNDTKDAIKQAQRIVNFVLKKIAEPETGQQELF